MIVLLVVADLSICGSRLLYWPQDAVQAITRMRGPPRDLPGTVFDIVLYEPEIPPNTGNVMRLCANAGARLHLIEPMGFVLSDRRLRRAGLDYRDRAEAVIHPSLDACRRELPDRRWFGLSTRGRRSYHEIDYRPDDVLLFGPETRGLPTAVLDGFDEAHLVRLPMIATSRSLNLANAVAIVVYEAWRQNGFRGSSEATQP